MKFQNKNSENKPKAQWNQDLLKTKDCDNIFQNNWLVEEYEFNHYKANNIHTALNSLKLFFGVAILAGPHAFSQSGLIGGIIGVAFGKLFI